MKHISISTSLTRRLHFMERYINRLLVHIKTKGLNKAAKTLLLVMILLPCFKAIGQDMTLERVWEISRQQYPLLKQKNLVEQTAALTIDNLSKGYLPQLSIMGQGTYQSDVTSIDISFPGLKFQELSKDQYRATSDISQLIYDGGVINNRQQIERLNATVEDQKVEVELYKVKERVTQLYFGVLLLDRQLQQLFIVRQDIRNGIKTLEAQVENGVVLRSHLNTLKAELLKNEQSEIELAATRKGIIQVLSLFLNKQLREDEVFILPPPPERLPVEVRRPEIKLFNAQKAFLTQQSSLIDAFNRPRTAAFLQAGYGKPGLNMLKSQFDPYYIFGVRLNWSFSGFYTAHSEKKLVEINRQAVDIQKEAFLLQTSAMQKEQLAEITKWTELLAKDKGIIQLRESIKEAAKAQLQNQVINSSDYLREVNAEDVARQNLIFHELKLLQAKINYTIITGGYGQ